MKAAGESEKNSALEKTCPENGPAAHIAYHMHGQL